MQLGPLTALVLMAQLGLFAGTEAGFASHPAGSNPGSNPARAAADEVGCPDTELGRAPFASEGLPPVTAVAVAPTTPTPAIYAGTWGNGLYQSHDCGISWSMVYDGPGQVTSIAVYPNDPQTVVAGTANLGVVQIAEGGGTYHWLSPGLPVLDVRSVAVDTSPAAAVYAGTVQGLFRSVDNGNTWSPFGLGNDQVSSVLVDRSDTNTVYAGTALNGIMVTRDGGSTWHALRSPGVSIDTMLLDPITGRVLYAGTGGGGVVRVGFFKTARKESLAKDDAPGVGPQVDPSLTHPDRPGNLPVSGPFGGTVIDLEMDPLTPTTLYAASYVGLFKTTDNGETWRLTGLTSHVIFSIAVDPVNPQNVYAGTRGQGLYKSADGGATWAASGDDLMRGKVIYALAVDPSNPNIIYAGGRALHADGATSGDWGGGLFKSADGGATWQLMDDGLPEGWVYTIVIDPTMPSTLYAGTHSMGVFKSVDGGTTWQSMNVGLVTAEHYLVDNLKVRSLAIDPHNPQNLIVGVWGGSGVLETNTGAESWQVAGNSSVSARVRAVAYNPAVPGLIYAGKIAGGASYLEADHADSVWKAFPDQARGGWADFSMVSAIAVNPVDGSTLFMGAYGIGILRSSDSGLTWKPVNNGFAATAITALVSVPSQPGTLYASTNGSGIFRSTDGGASWSLHTWTGPWDWALDMALDPSDPNVLLVATQGNGMVSVDLRTGE